MSTISSSVATPARPSKTMLLTVSAALFALGTLFLQPANADHVEGMSHTHLAKQMTVHKSPWCGCCTGWTKALEKSGYKMSVSHHDDLDPIKKQFGVPEAMAGCHTALWGDYVVEGHVPLEALAKLEKERPDIRGIAVPGMPSGSLGMGYDPKAQYTVYALPKDGGAPVPFYVAGQ